MLGSRQKARLDSLPTFQRWGSIEVSIKIPAQRAEANFVEPYRISELHSETIENGNKALERVTERMKAFLSL
jgi:hypothetical protein